MSRYRTDPCDDQGLNLDLDERVDSYDTYTYKNGQAFEPAHEPELDFETAQLWSGMEEDHD